MACLHSSTLLGVLLTRRCRHGIADAICATKPRRFILNCTNCMLWCRASTLRHDVDDMIWGCTRSVGVIQGFSLVLIQRKLKTMPVAFWGKSIWTMWSGTCISWCKLFHWSGYKTGMFIFTMNTWCTPILSLVEALKNCMCCAVRNCAPGDYPVWGALHQKEIHDVKKCSMWHWRWHCSLVQVREPHYEAHKVFSLLNVFSISISQAYLIYHLNSLYDGPPLLIGYQKWQHVCHCDAGEALCRQSQMGWPIFWDWLGLQPVFAAISMNLD